MDRYDAQTVETKWQRIWDESRAFEVPNPKPGAPRNERKSYVLEMLPYPSGTLHIGHVLVYTLGDVLAHFYRRTGSEVLEADGLRLLRAARGERCAEGGRASSRHRRAEHRVDPAHDEAARLGDRLVTRVLHPSARVLPLDAVALPEVLRGGSHVPEGCAGQLVPQRPDGAGERTGQERPLRAVRLRGRSAQARPVVLPHHRLRRQPDRRDEGAGLAGARPGDAAQLDRPLRRRGDPLPR